ncbi:MAG TPA: O-methyltransferase [Candidatus Limnocylindrales bacterium]|nr:O-methyltransferase [Candidatus Limnocylindrales bacterium]
MERWGEVDRYISDVFGLDDPVLDEAVRATEAAGMPQIQVSAVHGRLLQVLARTVNARRILEIGTLGGYSAIWLGRVLPLDGRLVTLELEPRHAEVARSNIDRAGLSDRVEVLVGPAVETLQRLVDDATEPFDLVFIDADKENYPSYLELSIKLAGPGTLIVADNVVRQGQVADPSNADPRVQGVRRFNELLAADARLTATVMQTVGAKSYDGLALAVVRDSK